MMDEQRRQTLRIGTRGSALALAQAELTEAALRQRFPELGLERVVIETTGDQRLDLRLAELRDAAGQALDKGVFTKELEIALKDGRIDVAVHSAKDVPTELPDGLVLAGALERAATEDVLIVAGAAGLGGLADLGAGARVGTSSVRRAAILRWRRDDLRPVDVRGNVQTRLRKLALDGGMDALVLARAGLERLGLDPASGRLVMEEREFSCAVLAAETMLCAAGQGVIAWEIRADDQSTAEILAGVSHAASWAALRAERALLAALGAGCQTPVSAWARAEGGELRMDAWLFADEDGAAPVQAGLRGSGDRPEALGRALAAELAGK